MKQRPAATRFNSPERPHRLMRLAALLLLALMAVPTGLAHGLATATGTTGGPGPLQAAAVPLGAVDPTALAVAGFPADLPERDEGAAGGVVAQAMGFTPGSALAPILAPAFPGVVPDLVPGLASGLLDSAQTPISFAQPPTKVYGAAGPGGTADMQFVCPQPPTGLPVVPSGSTDDPIVYGCPIRFRDTTYSLVNSAIAVNPDDANQVLITSLHGGSATNGPHDYSRFSQTQSAFTSDDQGITWLDQPISPDQQPSSASFGSDTDVVMDSAGNVYLAYLSDVPTGTGTWDAVVGLYKAPPTTAGYGVADTYNDPFFYIGRDPDNRITRAHLTHVPVHTPIVELNLTNETAPPALENMTGESAQQLDLANATEERVAVAWHETAYDYETSVTGLSGWVDVAWTDVGPRNSWHRLNRTQLIGPCSDGSNPIAWRGDVYVACVVEAGYADRPRARIGEVDLWKVNLETGNASLVGYTGVSGGGKPLLSIASTERGDVLAMLVYTKVRDGQGVLQKLGVVGGWGWAESAITNGQRLTPYGSTFGNQLRAMGGGLNVPVIDADITAFELIGTEGIGLIVYKEWHNDPQDPTAVDPQDPNFDPGATIGTQLLDYNKYFVSIDTCDGITSGYHVNLGQGVDAFNADQYANAPNTFNSVHDGLYVDYENDQPVVYFSLDDYGGMQYGGVLLQSVGNPACGLGFPPPPIPPAVIPQALTITNPLAGVVGAAFGVPAVAMLGYLLTAKRRSPLSLAVEDK